MGWLIGIVCVILVLVFWRVFLPLGVIAAAAIGLFVLHENNESEKRQREIQQAAQANRTKIAIAKQNETPKDWTLLYESDPASGKKIARTASIQSDDGLCFLSVQKRIEGTELAGLNCPGFEISKYSDIDVKFDTDEVSRRMRLDTYSNSNEVYIPSYQYDYSGHLKYEEFIKKLSQANTLAINIPAQEKFWTRFNLENAPGVISLLGTDGELPRKVLTFDDLPEKKENLP